MTSHLRRSLHPLRDYLFAFLLVAAITVPLWVLRGELTRANFSLIYALATLVVAVRIGTGPSLLAAILSFFGFSFYLFPLPASLAVADSRQLINLGIYLGVALIAGQLAAFAGRQTETARRQAAEQNVLYQLSSSFNQQATRQGIYDTLRRFLQEDLGARDVAFSADEPDAPPAGSPFNLVVPLQVGEEQYDHVQITFDTALPPSQVRLVRACVMQAAMGLHRIDLTERAQRSRALEEADKLKTALLHAVSHDLRTPITIIKTSASNLRALHQFLTEAERLEMIEAIAAEVDELNTMVGNLLDMSRLKAGGLVLNSDWNDLSEIIGDVAARAWQLSGRERVKILLPDDLPLVRCDYGLLLQAFNNLLENMIRYEPESSQVEVRAHHQGQEIVVALVNHGPNISPEDRQRIMEPFYSTDGSIGLGLPISKGIIEAHGGRLWVEDTPGGGATFTIALPFVMMENQPEIEG